MRPLLWVLLVVTAMANAVTSSLPGVNPAVGAGFGVVTLTCIVLLVRDYYRRRRTE